MIFLIDQKRSVFQWEYRILKHFENSVSRIFETLENSVLTLKHRYVLDGRRLGYAILIATLLLQVHFSSFPDAQVVSDAVIYYAEKIVLLSSN